MQAAMRTADGGTRADRLGVICSAACAVHCAAMPFLLAALPSLSVTGWLSDPLFHQIVAGICVVLVYRAIWPAWAVHRSRLVATAATGGIALICLSSFVLPSCCSGEFHAVPSAIHAARGHNHAAACTHDQSCPHDHSGPSEAAETSVALAGLPQLHSRPLLQHDDLHRLLGDAVSLRLLGAQPYLNPLGGCLLILAHVLNARLRRRGGCGCGHTY